MHDKFSGRIETALQRLAARTARSRKRLNREQVNRQIGRILQQNQRAAQRFKVHVVEDSGPTGFRLEVKVNAAFDDWAALSEGAYLLRSNISDWSDEQLCKAYFQLTQAEAAFRIQKDQRETQLLVRTKTVRTRSSVDVIAAPRRARIRPTLADCRNSKGQLL